jgi:hypothetical protein
MPIYDTPSSCVALVAALEAQGGQQVFVQLEPHRVKAGHDRLGEPVALARLDSLHRLLELGPVAAVAGQRARQVVDQRRGLVAQPGQVGDHPGVIVLVAVVVADHLATDGAHLPARAGVEHAGVQGAEALVGAGDSGAGAGGVDLPPHRSAMLGPARGGERPAGQRAGALRSHALARQLLQLRGHFVGRQVRGGRHCGRIRGALEPQRVQHQQARIGLVGLRRHRPQGTSAVPGDRALTAAPGRGTFGAPMDDPHPTVFASIAKEAVGSQLAATVVVGVVGLLCLAVGIAGSSVILGILGAVLALLSGMWCVRDVRRALVARGMQRFPD